MDTLTIVMIVIVSIGILYMIADKLVFPIYRGHQNKKKAARWIYCHFFHPTGGFPEHVLCEPVGAYHVQPPASHLKYFPKAEGGATPLYCLIGTKPSNPGDHDRAERMTVRDLWPPNAKSELEKVIVESAYFVIGRQQALNPYENFLPINTDLTTMILREEKSMQYVANIMNNGLETLESLDKFLSKTGKTLSTILIVVIVGALASIVSAVLAFLIHRGG